MATAIATLTFRTVRVPWTTEIKDGEVQVDCDEFRAPPPAGERPRAPAFATAMGFDYCPPLNVVIFIVGTRGERDSVAGADDQGTCCRTLP